MRTLQKRPVQLTSFWLHLIAMALMLCDHLWGTFLWEHAWLGYLGRMAFPIFAFLLVEGFFHTKSRKTYLLRLLLFALIAEIPFNLMMERRVFYPLHQNVLWSFVLSLLLLMLLDKLRGKGLLVYLPLAAVGLVGFYLLGIVTFVDYYGYGILMVALFYFTRPGPGHPLWRRLLCIAVQVMGMYWINCDMMGGLVLTVELFGQQVEFLKQGFALLALPLIWLYRGEQGWYNRGVRALYYWFYPVHCLILGLLLVLR